MGLAGSLPMPSITSPSESRISVKKPIAPGELRVEQLVDAPQLAARLGDVVGEPGDAGLPGQVELPARVPGDVEVLRLEVHVVRDEVVRDRRQVAVRLEPGGQPVGRHGDVPRGRVAGLHVGDELLAVRLVVVVPGLRVVDRDPGLVLEAVDGADLAVLGEVDVLGPVDDVDLVGAVAEPGARRPAAVGRRRRTAPAVAADAGEERPRRARRRRRCHRR